MRESRSIKSAMIIAFSFIIFCAVFAAYNVAIDEVESVSDDYVNELISQVNLGMDRYVEAVEDVGDVVLNNASVQQWVSDGPSMGKSHRMILEDDIQRWLSNIVNTRTDIRNIALFTPTNYALFDSRGKRINPYMDYMNTEWYIEALQSKSDKDVFITSSHVQNVVQGTYDWVVTMSKPITCGSGIVRGVLMIDLNYSLINNLCDSVDMGERGYIYVLDKRGNVIYHPRQQLIYSGIRSEYLSEDLTADVRPEMQQYEKNKKYISQHSSKTNWTTTGVAYQDEFLSGEEDIVGLYGIIFIVFMALAVGLSLVLCTAITKPLQNLIDRMGEIKPESLGEPIQIEGPAEVAQLSTAFNQMTDQLGESIRREQEEQEQRRISELNALQAQINPHFLYNTLDSIIWMAESDDTEAVVEMTAALARLFRSSISEARAMVPLAVELANIRSYLTIQKMRYQEKLSYTIDVPMALQHYQVPKLLLQPLVENAIYHGLKPKVGGGEIIISALLQGGKFIISVEDDGVGMGQVFSTKNQAEDSYFDGESIGVRNVNNRIKLIYGPGYGLQFEERPGGGTVVRIVLPREEAESE